MSYSCALYCRISRDAEGSEVGVSNQEAAGRELAAQHGLTVTAVYTDNDVSASTNSRKARPEFEAMLSAGDRGEFDTIVSYSMSRLTRRPAEWERLISLAQRRGVSYLYKVSPRYDLNTADGRATARTVAAWDAAEAERTSERRKFRNAEGVKKGIPAGRPRVFGFEADGMTPRVDEAELIRQAYADVLAGVPVRQIARSWNAAGWRTLRGNEWSAVTARNTLTRERNAGILIANGERRPESRITPIVSEETWEAACAILGVGASRKPSGRPTGERWLSGVATCACGEPLRVGASWSRGVYSPAYVCGLIAQASRTPGMSTPPGHARIKAELLESAAVPELRAAMGAGVSDADASPELARLVREEADVAAQLSRAKDLYATFGGADDLARAKTLQAELTRVGEAIQAARNATAAPLSEAARTLYRVLAEWSANPLEWGGLPEGAEALAQWEAIWPTLETEERRALARRHLSVTVNRPDAAERLTIAPAL